MDINVLETQLSGEYREVFKKAQVYAALKNIETAFSQEKLMELFDLLLTAQNDGKPVNKLVGSDVNRFCKDFFSDYTIVERLRFLPVTLYRMSWVMFVLELIEFLAAEVTLREFFTLKSDVSGYGVGLMVAAVAYLVMELVLAPIFSRSRRIKPGVWYGLVLGVMAALIAASTPLAGKFTLMLPIWPFLIGSGLYIVVYVILRAIWRYRNYGSVSNTRKQMEKDSYYRNLQDRDIEKVLLTSWQKRFVRLQKKGKVTEESYLDELTKNEELGDKLFKYVTPLIYIAVCVFSVVQVARDSGIADTIFFAVFISGFTFLVYRWLYKIEVKNAALRKKHISECRRQGKTMPQYIEDTLENF